MEWWAYGGLFLVLGLLTLAGLVLWIWALVDCVQVPDDAMYQSGTKLVWVLIIVLLGFIGAIVYLLAGRPTADSRERSARSTSPPAAPGAAPRPDGSSSGPPAMPPPPT
ncbi:MAG TPA: PLD nuclease N-terminal domain-containing protein [Actinomycetota bacterium]